MSACLELTTDHRDLINIYIQGERAADVLFLYVHVYFSFTGVLKESHITK